MSQAPPYLPQILAAISGWPPLLQEVVGGLCVIALVIGPAVIVGAIVLVLHRRSERRWQAEQLERQRQWEAEQRRHIEDQLWLGNLTDM